MIIKSQYVLLSLIIQPEIVFDWSEAEYTLQRNHIHSHD